MLSARRIVVFFVFCAACLWGGGVAQAKSRHAVAAHAQCGSERKWCEHKVATFCQDEACSNVRTEGQCVSKETNCDEFWCGNRQCQGNWLFSNNVCCEYYQTGQSGNEPQYSCASSELSCPGNNARLTIRPTLASADIDTDN